MAARLLFDHWFKLVYGGQAASAYERLSEFPPEMSSSSPEVAALIASAELTEGSVEEAEARIDRASVQAASVSGDRRERLQVMLSVLALSLARRRGDLPAADDQARQLLAPAVVSDPGQFGIGDELRALAMIKLGIAEAMSNRVEAAEQHLERGVSLARRIGQPYLELTGLGHLAIVAGYHSVATETKWSERAIELGLRHGWEEEPEMAPAYLARALPLIWAARLDEAESLLVRARRALRAEADPGSGWMLEVSHGFIEIARGRTEQALVAFREAERLAELLVPAHQLRTSLRSLQVQCLVRLGDVEAAASMLERMDEQERETETGRSALAALLLARGHPEQAASLLASVVGDPPAGLHEIWLAIAMLLDAKAKAAFGDIETAQDALEQLLDMAEREHLVLPFLLYPVPELLERHRGHRTTHAGLVADILDLLSGDATRRTEPQRPYEQLTESELRVLRYLPTNLSIPEIAGELNLSANTVKTHVRHLYAKLDAHGRSEAVERARDLALLAGGRTARS